MKSLAMEKVSINNKAVPRFATFFDSLGTDGYSSILENRDKTFSYNALKKILESSKLSSPELRELWQDIMHKKIYPLLPLQVYKLKRKLHNVKKRVGDNSAELRELILEAKETTRKVLEESRDLYDRKEINYDDLHAIFIATEYLFEYLNAKYFDNVKFGSLDYTDYADEKKA